MAATSPSTAPTCPPTRTASGSSPTVAASAPSEFSDPDASWGHRSAVSTRKGGGFYGYKLDMAVCTATDLPLAWNVRTARDNESTSRARRCSTRPRARGFAGRDVPRWTRATTSARSTTGARTRDVPPDHPAPPDARRRARRPQAADVRARRVAVRRDRLRAAARPSGAARTGECKPASVWIKADRLHPLIPRETPRFTAALPSPRRRRARVRPAQARVGARPASRPWTGSGSAARRPDDPRQARLRAQPSASRTARGVENPAASDASPRDPVSHVLRVVRAIGPVALLLPRIARSLGLGSPLVPLALDPAAL